MDLKILFVLGVLVIQWFTSVNYGLIRDYLYWRKEYLYWRTDKAIQYK